MFVEEIGRVGVSWSRSEHDANLQGVIPRNWIEKEGTEHSACGLSNRVGSSPLQTIQEDLTEGFNEEAALWEERNQFALSKQASSLDPLWELEHYRRREARPLEASHALVQGKNLTKRPV
jgi:hypothetical protein